jgi:hypothetical protein
MNCSGSIPKNIIGRMSHLHNIVNEHRRERCLFSERMDHIHCLANCLSWLKLKFEQWRHQTSTHLIAGGDRVLA